MTVTLPKWGETYSWSNVNCVVRQFLASVEFTFFYVNQCCSSRLSTICTLSLPQVHNVIVGSLWMEHQGTMEVRNHVTGHKATITFKPGGWFSGKKP